MLVRLPEHNASSIRCESLAGGSLKEGDRRCRLENTGGIVISVDSRRTLKANDSSLDSGAW